MGRARFPGANGGVAREQALGAFDDGHVDHFTIERPRAAAGGGMDGVLLHDTRRLRDFLRRRRVLFVDNGHLAGMIIRRP